MKYLTLKSLIVYIPLVAIWNFAYIVAAFYLMYNTQEQLMATLRVGTTIWCLVTLPSVLFIGLLVWPVERSLRNLEKIPDKKLISITRRALDMNLYSLYIYAANSLISSFFMYFYLIGQHGNLSSISIWVGGIPAFIACPFMVYGGFSLLFSGANKKLTGELTDRKLVAKATYVNIFTKLLLIFGATCVGIGVWVGGLAFYSGVNQMIEEVKESRKISQKMVIKHCELSLADTVITLQDVEKSIKDLVEQAENETVFITNIDGNILYADTLFEITPEIEKVVSEQLFEEIAFYDNKSENVFNLTPLNEDLQLVSVVNIGAQMHRMDVFMWWFLFFLAVCFGVALINVYAVSSWIRKTTSHFEHLFMALTKNNYSENATKDSEDELGSIVDKYNVFISTVRKLIHAIQNTSSSVADSGKQFNQIAVEISHGANEQASSVEEISASMEEMAAGINQNNKHTQNSLKISKQITSEVKGVNDSFRETLLSMEEIREKVSIINDIANKTDILAINASVEATRAGEHGKGFSVVATEIRKLAEHSGRAADEIDSLSNRSYRTAEETGGKLEYTTLNINKIIQLIEEIALASNEQNSGAEQINTTLQQLVNITNQNSTTAEELSAGSEELNVQADGLNELILNFQLTKKKKIKKEDLLIKIAKKLQIPIDDYEGGTSTEKIEEFVTEHKEVLEEKGIGIDMNASINDEEKNGDDDSDKDFSSF